MGYSIPAHRICVLTWSIAGGKIAIYNYSRACGEQLGCSRIHRSAPPCLPYYRRVYRGWVQRASWHGKQGCRRRRSFQGWANLFRKYLPLPIVAKILLLGGVEAHWGEQKYFLLTYWLVHAQQGSRATGVQDWRDWRAELFYLVLRCFENGVAHEGWATLDLVVRFSAADFTFCTYVPNCDVDGRDGDALTQCWNSPLYSFATDFRRQKNIDQECSSFF